MAILLSIPRNIIKLEEVEYVRKIDNIKWHFFDIIAKKEKDIWIDEINNNRVSSLATLGSAL